MASFRSCTLSVACIFLLFLSFCHAVELEEIRPLSARQRLGARDLAKRDMSALDLKNSQTFLWGSEDDVDILLGNLTVHMPDADEHILSMEQFAGMLTKIECSPTAMTLGFEDDKSFAYAQKVWDWVNGADNHTFVMVTGKGDCGPDTRRTPYLVSSIEYDEAGNVAHLDAKEGTWKDLAHSYVLRVGKVPMDKSLGLRRRDYNADSYMDLGVDLSMRLKVETGPIVGELICSPCYSAGRMHFELVIETWLFVPKGAVMKLSPEGVKVAATLKLNVASNFGTKTRLPTYAFPKIALAGVSIPGGILTVGPVLEVTLGGEVKAEGTVSITAGASAALSNSAIVQVDLLNPSDNKFSGWAPDLQTQPLQMQAKASVTLKEFLEPRLVLQAEALGKGLEAGVSLRMPYVEAKAEALVSQGGGACQKGDKYDSALRIVTQWGFELKFRAGTIGDNQGVDVTLGTASFPLGAPICKGFNLDPVSSAKGLPAPSGTSAASNPTGTTPGSQPSSSPGGGTPGNPCTNTITKKTGVCLSISVCKDAGDESAPGYCANDPDGVQCCTSKNVAPGPAKNSCTVGSATGECISTGSCKAAGKKSTRGHCPSDPTGIQCCTGDEASPPGQKSVPSTCKVGDKTGGCVSTSFCKASGKKSTPGFCLDDPTDIQCCTDDAPAPTPSGKTCKVSNTPGECVSTAACKSSGKKSTPGYCPTDPTDIQCCTAPEPLPVPSTKPPTPSGKTCKVGNTPGECLSTVACKSAGKESTPGYCPTDPTDIQCCTLPEPAPSAQPPPTPPASSPSTKSCKVGNTPGQCISTAACKSSGKKSTPGYCPNDPDNVQCCTSPDPAPSAQPSPAPKPPSGCTVGSLSGTCVSTSSCKSSKKQSTPGHCPNDPDDIQCCTGREPASAPPPSSTTGSRPPSCSTSASSPLGECISTSACSSNGGTSTAGHCAGAANIQCCTYDPCTLAGGKKGDCMGTSACKAKSGTSTPGRCPNSPGSVECCMT